MSPQGIRLSTSSSEDTSHDLVTRLDRLPVDSIGNDIARGKVAGAVNFVAFGERTHAGAQTDKVIWSNGDFNGPASGGVQMSIVSTSVNDTSTGTGLRSIELHYLDSDLKEKVETVVLNGTTPVLTQSTDIHFINLFHVVTFGAGKAAAGDIIASNNGVTYAEIITGNLVQTSTARMIPANKKLYVAGATAGTVSLTAAARVTIGIYSNTYNGLIFSDPFILLPQLEIDLQDNSIAFNFPVPSCFPAGSVVAMVSTNNKSCTVSGTIYGWTEDA